MKFFLNDGTEKEIKINTKDSLFPLKKAERDYGFKLEVSQKRIMIEYLDQTGKDINDMQPIMTAVAKYQSSEKITDKEKKTALDYLLKASLISDELFEKNFDTFWINGEDCVNEVLQAITQSDIDFWNDVSYYWQKEIIQHFLLHLQGVLIGL